MGLLKAAKTIGVHISANVLLLFAFAWDLGKNCPQEVAKKLNVMPGKNRVLVIHLFHQKIFRKCDCGL